MGQCHLLSRHAPQALRLSQRFVVGIGGRVVHPESQWVYGEAWVRYRHWCMVERDRGRGSGSVDNKTAKGATCGAGVAGIASVAGVDCIS